MPYRPFVATSKKEGRMSYSLAPSRSQIPPLPVSFPKISLGRDGNVSFSRPIFHSRIPVKVSTVSLVGRQEKTRTAPSAVTDMTDENTNYASLEECLDSRPPMRLDMSGPKPTTYDPPTKLPWETQAPAYTMRPKTQPEKDSGGDRVAWKKQWMASPDIWTYRVDFDNRVTWPSPADYQARPTLGNTHITLPQSPAHSMGRRQAFVIGRKGADKEPSPNQYNHDIAKAKVLRRFPSYTIQEGRRGGTMVWTAREPVPGPGSYNPRSYTTSSKRCAPCFSISRSSRTIGLTRNCTL